MEYEKIKEVILSCSSDVPKYLKYVDSNGQHWKFRYAFNVIQTDEEITKIS